MFNITAEECNECALDDLLLILDTEEESTVISEESDRYEELNFN